MTTPFVDLDIRAFEGLRLQAYADPLSPLGRQLALRLSDRVAGWELLSGAPWTVGYGCTGAGINRATIWTASVAEQQQVERRLGLEAQLEHATPWWRALCDPRQDVLSNMAYQVGVHGICRFPSALAAMRRGDWAAASEQLLDSDWARNETPRRAEHLAEQMKTGVRVAP